MKRNDRAGSHLFFIEFIIVLFFFLIVSTVCLRLLRARMESRSARMRSRTHRLRQPPSRRLWRTFCRIPKPKQQN